MIEDKLPQTLDEVREAIDAAGLVAANTNGGGQVTASFGAA